MGLWESDKVSDCRFATTGRAACVQTVKYLRTLAQRTRFQDEQFYFTVLCDPHPRPLSLTGRGETPQQDASDSPLCERPHAIWVGAVTKAPKPFRERGLEGEG